MKKAIVVLVVALALPTSVAFAKSPHGHGAKSGSAPKVQYVLKGTLSGYVPASTTATGQITITVKHSNYHGRLLNGKPLMLTLTTSSKITFRRGSHAHGQITDGTKGNVTLRAP